MTAEEPESAAPRRTTDRCPRTGKLAHPSRAAAVHALEGHRVFLRHKGGGYSDDGVMGVYRCDGCGGRWHVGTASDAMLGRQRTAKVKKRERQDRLRELREREAEEDMPC